MNNRKILTLNEILSLDRRPTLQEMVDLSDEDYCKFLFERGVIPFIPEDFNLEVFEELDYKYGTFNDIVWNLNHHDNSNPENDCLYGVNYYDKITNEQYVLNESLFEKEPIEKNVTIYDKFGNEFMYSYEKEIDSGYPFYFVGLVNKSELNS